MLTSYAAASGLDRTPGEAMLRAADWIDIDTPSPAEIEMVERLNGLRVPGLTLAASIYGMNFKSMPELDWTYGDPYGLGMILLSAVVPLLLFRPRGCL